MKTLTKITLLLTLNFLASGYAQAKNEYKTVDIKVVISQEAFEATTYNPIGVKPKAILIITPTIGGISSVEKSNADYFAKRGYFVILTHPFVFEMQNPTPDIAKMDDDFFKPTFANEAFLVLVEKKFGLKEDLPVVALGASQGGIITLVLAAQMPRIKASWIFVAGGDFPSLYAYSQVPKMILYRNNHMRHLGFEKVSEFKEFLRNNLKNDPLNVCRDIKGQLVQVIATRDTYVPTANQELIASKCPTNKVMRHKVTHQSGVLLSLNQRKDIMEYFDKIISKYD
jgi:dienelactone hydrolase